ncbi:MAG: helix-turn-helix transcriptional regulator [Epibacterium sp.]
MTPAQCRAARALIGLTQTELAQRAEIGLSTIVDFEKERRKVSSATIESLRNSLQEIGIVFLCGEIVGVGVEKGSKE